MRKVLVLAALAIGLFSCKKEKFNRNIKPATDCTCGTASRVSVQNNVFQVQWVSDCNPNKSLWLNQNEMPVIGVSKRCGIVWP